MTWIRKALYVVFLFALQLERLLSVSVLPPALAEALIMPF